MNDESIVKIMQSLGLDYRPAIDSTIQFQKTISDLNKQLANMKAIAIQNAKDINTVFSSQLKQSPGNQTIVDQYGNAFKAAKLEATRMNVTLKEQSASIKQSTLEQMKAQAASVQQRVTTKHLNQDYARQAGTLREQLSVIQSRLQAEGQLTAEETRQTQQLKEQLDILRAQTNTAASDNIRENPSTFGQEWERRSSWFLTGAMFYGTINAAKETKETIKDVEMGMVEIQRVMSDSSFVFDEYRDNLLQLGIDYGQTFDNVQNIALRWAQSGYNVADSLKLTETSLLALNAGELDAKYATEAMIGIMSQWRLEAEDLSLVMDKVNKTADSYSTTAQDLIDGLLRSSSAARTMNMSIDETLSLLTLMRESSGRTGKEVGNALNSIISYIQRPASINVMEDMGIDVFADRAKTEFRNVLEIFQDISNNWGNVSTNIQEGFIQSADDAELFNEELATALGMQEEWNDLQKRDMSQAAAGVHRRNYFIGMIERMADVQGVLNNMMDAEGYTMEKNALAMDTLEKKQESLKASAEALAVAIGDAGLEAALSGLLGAGTNAINLINDMPKPMKDLVLATTSTFVAVKTLEVGMKTFGIQLPGVSQMIGSLTSGTWSLTDALKAGGTGLATFAKANAPLLALSAAVGTIMAITNAVKKQREEMEQSLEVFRQQREVSNSINELIPQYEELASKSKLNAEEQQKLLDVKRQITDLLPETKDALDNENLSLSTQLEIIKELNDEELNRAKQTARENLSKYEDGYDYAKQRIEDATKALEGMSSRYEELYQKRDNLSRQEQQEFDNLPLRMKAQQEALENYSKEVEIVDNSIEVLNSTLKDTNVILDESTNKVNSSITSHENYTKAVDDLIESFNDSTSSLQSYYSMLDEVNSKEGLSAKHKQEIISKHHELLPYLGDEAELREQLMEIIKEEEKVQHDAYSNMLMYSEEFFNAKILGNKELADQLNEYYGIDLANYKSLADAKNDVESSLISTLSQKWQRYFAASSAGLEQTIDNLARSAVGGNVEAGKMIDELYPAYKKLLESEEAFKNISLDFGGIDFKGINTSGIKEPKKGSKSKSERYENKPLEEALRLLEHRKRISEETQSTIRDELDELQRINRIYVKTNEERMDMAERLYSVQKKLRDRMFSDSSKWISDKKALDDLSIEEEIKAWERVRETHINNLEYRKQAELNLYKLRKQIMDDSFSREENSIKHLTNLGVLSVGEQIKKYRELYQVKASSLSEEQARVENLFNLYKRQITEQHGLYKEAHDDRIRQIEDESKRRIEAIEKETDLRTKAQESIIEGIEKELDLLNKQDQEYDHDKKMADLYEELAYWEVRTSEDARKKVIDIKKQIDEANHKREVDLQKQSLEEQRKKAQDEIKNIEDTSRDKIREIEESSRKEVELAEKSYKEIEVAFDEHSINLIALASTTSEGMFEEFKKNYLIPLEKALKDGNYNLAGGIVGDINEFGGSLDGYADDYKGNLGSDFIRHDWGMSDADYIRFIDNGNRWAELQRQGANANRLEMDRLNAENDRLREKYGRDPNLGEYPKFHTGAKTLSYGAAIFKPGELVFPPDLSTRLETLISVLYERPINKSSSSSLTDNRRETKIGTLLNVENMHMEDDVDSGILVRQLQRTLTSI